MVGCSVNRTLFLRVRFLMGSVCLDVNVFLVKYFTCFPFG